VSVDPPPNLPPRRKLAVEQPLGGSALKSGKFLVYGAVVAVLGGLAVYNTFVQLQPLTSPYVIAPAIGAVWFALRLLMIWSSNARG
jgi:hypothetical protein